MRVQRLIPALTVALIVWTIMNYENSEVAPQQVDVPPSPIRRQSPEPDPSGQTEPERPDPITLVRASEDRINETLNATRQKIADMQTLASRLEERIARLPRLDPDVRRDHAEELRDVRRQAVTDIQKELREIPHRIDGWKDELDSIVLAGNSEAIEIDARARSHLEWLEKNGQAVLGDLLGRFERMELP